MYQYRSKGHSQTLALSTMALKTTGMEKVFTATVTEHLLLTKPDGGVFDDGHVLKRAVNC